MERNPYSPPISPITDRLAEPLPATINREVQIACTLIWISFALSLVGLVRELLSNSRPAAVIGALVGAAIIGVLAWWYTSKLKAGRNWMRIVVTIMIVLSYVSIAVLWRYYYAKFFANYGENPLKVGILAVKTITSIATIILLNLPSTRAWFSAMKEQRRNFPQ